MLTRRNFLKYLLQFFVTGMIFGISGCTKVGSKLKNEARQNNEISLPEPLNTKNLFLKNNIINDIKILSGEEFQGREAGTIGEEKAAQYLTNRLYELGLKPLISTGYQQAFTIPHMQKKWQGNRLVFYQADNLGLRTPCANVLGILKGKSKDKNIILSAHFDHLGIFENKIFPGANDNASGVACVLEVIRRLISENIHLRANIIAAFWSAEEMGFLGSRAFLANPIIPLKSIKAVINADTVGNGQLKQFHYWCDDRNLAVDALIKASKSSGATINFAERKRHNSDQVSFSNAGIPAVTILAKDWLNNNHTPKDTIALINEKKVQLAADIIFNAVKILDKEV